MFRYMLVPTLLFLLGGGTTPALAHAPEVGERAWFTMTCKEEAHETLIELAQTKGMSWVAHKLMRFTNSGKCVLRLPPAPGLVTAVEGPIRTRGDRFILYSMEVRLDGDEASRTWFAVHAIEVEGEEL